MDFSADRRGEMIDYVIEKYGRNHTARVGAFQITKVKAAISNAGRMLGMPVEQVANIKKTIPFNVKDEYGEKITEPTFKDIINDNNAGKFRQAMNDYPELFKIATDLESHPKTYSIHAAGVVIVPDDLMDKIPIRVDKKTGCYVSTIDKHYIEKIGIKYDFLPLQTAALVDKTCQDAGIHLDLSDDSFFEDKAVWAAIGSTNTTGMFQISSDLYKQHMPKLHPTNLQELAACLALVRGPCIAAGTDEIYMDVVNKKKEIELIDPGYDKVCKGTNGICIYQEEVMALGVAYGFTLDESYKLMKAIK